MSVSIEEGVRLTRELLMGERKQSLEEKMTNLETLLPLIEAQVYLHRRVVQSYGAENVVDPEFPPPPPDPADSCNLHCSRCSERGEREDELWARVYANLRQAYPVLEEIERLLPELAWENLLAWLAVYYEYVQPWQAWRPSEKSRQECMREGLLFLAERLDEYVPLYVPPNLYKRLKEIERRERNAEIIRLHESGQKVSRFARAWGLSDRQVRRIISADRAAES